MVELFWITLSIAVWTGAILYGSHSRRHTFNRVERWASYVTWAIFAVSLLILHFYFVAAVGAF